MEPEGYIVLALNTLYEDVHNYPTYNSFGPMDETNADALAGAIKEWFPVGAFAVYVVPIHDWRNNDDIKAVLKGDQQ